MKTIRTAEFTDQHHYAAAILRAAVENFRPLPADMTCQPFVVADDMTRGAGGMVATDPDGRYVSFGPPQQLASLLDVATHVFPKGAVETSYAFGFVVPLQITQVSVGRQVAVGHNEGDLPEAPTVVKVVRLDAAAGAEDANQGAGALAAYVHFTADDTDVCVGTPADDLLSTAVAFEFEGWASPEVVPLIVSRLAGSRPTQNSVADMGLASVVGASQLYVAAWVKRLAEAASAHGVDADKTQQVLQKPPRPTTVERATPEKVMKAVADGRIPSQLNKTEVEWAGPDLTFTYLMAELKTVADQLEQLEQIDEQLARQAAEVIAGRYDLDVDAPFNI